MTPRETIRRSPSRRARRNPASETPSRRSKIALRAVAWGGRGGGSGCKQGRRRTTDRGSSFASGQGGAPPTKPLPFTVHKLHSEPRRGSRTNACGLPSRARPPRLSSDGRASNQPKPWPSSRRPLARAEHALGQSAPALRPDKHLRDAPCLLALLRFIAVVGRPGGRGHRVCPCGRAHGLGNRV